MNGRCLYSFKYNPYGQRADRTSFQYHNARALVKIPMVEAESVLKIWLSEVSVRALIIY